MSKYVLYWDKGNSGKIVLKVTRKDKMNQNKKIRDRFVTYLTIVTPNVFKPRNQICNEYFIWSPEERSYVLVNISLLNNMVESKTLIMDDLIKLYSIEDYLLNEYINISVDKLPVSIVDIVNAAKHIINEKTWFSDTRVRYIRHEEYDIVISYHDYMCKIFIIKDSSLINGTCIVSEKGMFSKNLELIEKMKDEAGDGVVRVTRPTDAEMNVFIGNEFFLKINKHYNILVYRVLPVKLNCLADYLLEKL